MTQVGEIRVCGVHAGGFFIEDLRLLVPQNVIVPISAADAYRSRDLWRGLGMNSLHSMGLLGEVVQPVTVASTPEAQPTGDLRIAALEEQNRHLRELLATQAEAEAVRDATQQRLLQAVESLSRTVQVVPVAQAIPGAPTAQESASKEVVSGDAPMFIPSRVGAVTSEARVSVASSESSSEVHQSRNALRKLRGGGTQ